MIKECNNCRNVCRKCKKKLPQSEWEDYCSDERWDKLETLARDILIRNPSISISQCFDLAHKFIEDSPEILSNFLYTNPANQ